MTRARALKHAIRARAAKTGERYTTARRHVLNAPTAPDAPNAPSAPAVPGTRSPVSDAKVREKTGHGLDHWFAVLDRFGAVEKGHTAAARHLCDVHRVPGWHAQSITVAFERARGVRVANQRCDGDFEVSVSKVVSAETATIIKAFTDRGHRQRWTAAVDPALAKALVAGLNDKTSKGFVVRPDGLGRFRYKWDGTTVQFYVTEKPGGKASIVVQHTRLADAGAVDERRAQWKAAFAALASYLSAR